MAFKKKSGSPHQLMHKWSLPRVKHWCFLRLLGTHQSLALSEGECILAITDLLLTDFDNFQPTYHPPPSTLWTSTSPMSTWEPTSPPLPYERQKWMVPYLSTTAIFESMHKKVDFIKYTVTRWGTCNENTWKLARKSSFSDSNQSTSLLRARRSQKKLPK